jgi:Spy/CpxP family protein refolding chaperone
MLKQISFCAITMLFIGSLSAIFAADSVNALQNEKAKKVFEDLGLSTVQKAKLKDLRIEMQAMRKDHFEKMKVMREKIKEEILKESPSQTALHEFAKDIGNLRMLMAEKESEHLLKVKAILTPEQFKKLLSKELWQGADNDGRSRHWELNKSQ